jgi:hypothetical protein
MGAFLGTMEWLFFATKPSFLTVFSTEQRIMSLLGTVGVLAVLMDAVGVFLISIARLVFFRFPRFQLHILSIAPAIALTAISLLLTDNFSNTLLGFGSEDSIGLSRLIYLLLIVGCLGFYIFTCERWITKYSFLGPRHFFITAVVLSIFLAITSIGTADDANQQEFDPIVKNGLPTHNILIIGSDGVNASNLSLYGYHRETSMFLEELAGESMWALNAFTNSAHTGGTIISMMTGKLPIESGVIYPPDVLKGQHSYQSLPALLRAQYSYRTFQASFPEYADALDMNLRNAFDVVNGRSGIEDSATHLFSNHLGEATRLLLKATLGRLKTRLLHIFYVQDSHDAFAEVTGKASSVPKVPDQQRLKDLFDFIDTSADPFFAHVHMMGTHGPNFNPRVRKFSLGQEQTEGYMPDFYDDAIADFDRYLGEVFRELKRRDLLEKTVVVVYSDHGIRFSTDVQLPLLFWLPGSASGTITNNVQTVDIPKTILDTLGIPAPSWMGGRSLFSEALDPCQLIVSTSVKYKEPNEPLIAFEGLPSLGTLRLIIGESYYHWSLLKDEIYIFKVHYETPQPNCRVWSKDEVRDFFRQSLAEAGHKPSI